MAWENSNRRERLPENWPTLVAETKRRAKGRCQQILPSGKRCPRRGTDTDHKIPGDDHRQSNLQLLCEHHHAIKSSKEGRAARMKRYSAKPKPVEPHPGDVR